MIQLVEKLSRLEQDVAAEMGEFSLFGLLMREDSPDKWDLVAAAPWIESDEGAALKYLSNQIRERLNPQELLALSRVVLVDDSDPRVQNIHRAINVEHGVLEFKDDSFFDMPVKHAYIFTSKSADGTTLVESSQGG